MFRRRLAVLGAVAVLAITGLAGSAMADETPAPTAGSKMVCTTSDGKTIELMPALPAGDVLAAREGEAVRAGADGVAVRVTAMRDGAEGEPGQVVKGSRVASEEVPEMGVALPARLAQPGDAAEGVAPPENGLAETVSISCKKAE
ncbi:hypothetical protein AB0M50_20775 [Nonomuraea fuscirosea]|uniref:hypothetical protein n=1 Tax=Nonomuraea fuscirosea TaxID=1291556 RepID=UPI003426F34B